LLKVGSIQQQQLGEFKVYLVWSKNVFLKINQRKLKAQGLN